MRTSNALAVLVLAALAVGGCAPRGKAYGPVSDAIRAEQIAKEMLSGSSLANGPFKTRKQGDTWIVEADHVSESARLEIDAHDGRVRSYSAEVVDVDLIKPLPKSTQAK